MSRYFSFLQSAPNCPSKAPVAQSQTDAISAITPVHGPRLHPPSLSSSSQFHTFHCTPPPPPPPPRLLRWNADTLFGYETSYVATWCIIALSIRLFEGQSTEMEIANKQTNKQNEADWGSERVRRINKGN